MCYALLTTCHTCTWLLTVSYPRCSHAKAYALDPSACPHRMRRRYKASGLCAACKSHAKGKGKDIRNESLSVKPCEVRIEFRDTEVGAVAEGDKVGAAQKEVRSESVDKGGRKVRARKGVVQSHRGSAGDDSDDDVYVDDASPGASSVSSAGEEASEREEVVLPRKHKAGARPSPRTLPKPKGQTRRRKRSPGVLERLRMPGGGGVKKGRPPKVKMVWPDRIDAGEFEEVERERRRDAQKESGVERPVAKARKARKQPVLDGQDVSYERRIATNRKPSGGQRQSYVSEATGLAETSVPPYVGAVDEVDDLARIIAFEASKRDKKWR